MAGKIPSAFIQELLARIDLVELIDARVPLKRSGNNFLARCPFHNEKTPSFNVSREKQFYHCFGCGAHGNAIDFLREYDRLAFFEAVESLADSVGLKLPTSPDREMENRREDLTNQLFEVQERAARFYHDQFKTNPEAARAIAYLKQRGVTGELAQRYRLGYAPPGWQNLPKSWPHALLESAGLVISKDGKNYDRFRDRIMFPIRNRRGRVVGFGGRVLGDETPKYLNSPETPVFKKHREIYGLYELLKAQAKPRYIVVVEGYMDVIALAQYGVSNAVATLGTATSGEHIDCIFRYVNEIVFCFDGDRAGREAAWKALEASLPALRDGRTLRFLTLPDGQDPDSLIRSEGTESFLARVENAPPFSRYFVERLKQRLGFATIATPEQRAALVHNANPLIAKLPAGSFREAIENELANLAGRALVEGRERPATRGEIARAESAHDRTVPSLLRRFLGLLLQNPHLAAAIPPDNRRRLETNAKAGELIRKLLRLLDERPSLSLGGLLEYFRDTPEEAWIGKLSEGSTGLISADETAACLEAVKCIDESANTIFRDLLDRLDEQMRTERLDALIQKSTMTTLTPEENEEMRILTTWRQA